MDRRIGFIGILIADRQQSADAVNEVISRFADAVISRTGVPYRSKEVSVITLIVDITTDNLGDFTGRLGALPGVSVKSGLVEKA
ncbi:MAG: TM1266 family iron-only hydrogenase system putative regulator [Fibrobacterota bacterium]